MKLVRMLCAGVAVFGMTTAAQAEDGYNLWLRYGQPASMSISVPQASTTLNVAAAELRRGLPRTTHPIVLERASAPEVAALGLKLDALGGEGYAVRQVRLGGRAVTLVTGNSDVAILYGTFALIRHAHTGGSVDTATLTSAPHIKLRMLDHWDNLDGSVERGYAGQSLWDWWTLPDFHDPRYVDYARANASIGINGTVLNNVNAKPDSLTAPYIAKAAALADIFRP